MLSAAMLRAAGASRTAAARFAPGVARARAQTGAAARRRMASDAHHDHHGPHVNETHRLLGKGYLTVMWLWIFYRAKQDGPVVLGWEHPWDHMEHGDHGHDDHHGSHSEIQWVKEKVGAMPRHAEEDDKEESVHGEEAEEEEEEE
ncbi:unnamed protein product [Phaeothamnion confervicola]